jgi:hypothetical protein
VTRPQRWLDCETTGLDLATRRAWDVAVIERRPDGVDVEHQWFLHAADIDLSTADPAALDIGGFWHRHPQAGYLRAGGSAITAPDRPGVHRAHTVLEAVAQLTAGAVVLGSGPWFDMMTLGPRMVERGITPAWYYHPDDVPAMVKGFLAGWVGMTDELRAARSDELVRAIGLDPDSYGRHTAIGDCRLFRDAYDVLARGGRTFQDERAAAAAAAHFASASGAAS